MNPSRLNIPAFVLAFALFSAFRAEAIPAFARKYDVACNMCHTSYPQLNRFGRDFRDNGFRLPEDVEKLRSGKKEPSAPSDQTPPSTATPQEGDKGQNEDFWSFIPEQIPFSIQAKLHDLINPKGQVTNDFQVEELQLQTGGTLTPRVSYYLHHHLVEEGEPGTLYTGWFRINNLFGSDWLNVTVGQIELPLSFSPEIERLSSFEYLSYGRTLGANAFTLSSPQLGVQVFGQSSKGTKLWVGVANGYGLSINEETETNDNNSFKDFYARVGQEVDEHFFGAYAYYGRARGSIVDGSQFSDNFLRVGGDGFLNFERVIVYGTLLYARDENPLGTQEQRTFYGGFVECDVHISDRAVVLMRFDGVHQRLPASVDVPQEETKSAPTRQSDEGEENPFRVNTLAFTPGVQYLLLPNFKLSFEYQIRQSREEDRAIAQLHASF